MQTQPSSSSHLPATSCGLAVASLICGLCSLFLGPFTGIPAIITGHMASGRIKRSGGALEGAGMALAGLILGYIFSVLYIVIIPILVAVSFAAGKGAITRSHKTTALATATSLETSINSFYNEYSAMPTSGTGTSDVTLQTDVDTEMLDILLGNDMKLNPRSIHFLVVKEGRAKKNGIIYSPDGSSVIGLFDPWGHGYRVRLDFDYDGKIVVNPKTEETLKDRHVAVWSAGPDGVFDTEDDVKTW